MRGEVEQIVETARVLEGMGFDGLSYGDHRATARSPHLWTALAAIAAATTRVTIASTFANNLFRHPTEFVQAALSVDALSDGRFEAGIGAGWARIELEAIGQALPPPAERLDRLAEACVIARPLLRGDGCQFAGQHYSAFFEPTPAGAGPPLVAAVGGPVACRRIAPLVDRVEVLFGGAVAGGSLDFEVWQELTVDHLRRRIDIVRDVAPTVKIGVGVFAAAGDDEEARRLAVLAGTGLQAQLVGEPRAVAEALHRLGELDIDRVGITPMTAATARLLGAELDLDRGTPSSGGSRRS